MPALYPLLAVLLQRRLNSHDHRVELVGNCKFTHKMVTLYMHFGMASGDLYSRNKSSLLSSLVFACDAFFGKT